MSSDYKYLHEAEPFLTGKGAVICGGSASLIADLADVPEDYYKISVNLHLINAGIVPDMVVYIDRHIGFSFDEMRRSDSKYKDVIVIGMVNHLSDYVIHRTSFPYVGLSGVHATLIAKMLGADPILLAGMDGYENEERPDMKHMKEKSKRAWKKCFDFDADVKTKIRPASNNMKAFVDKLKN